jgi:hypothetical protein
MGNVGNAGIGARMPASSLSIALNEGGPEPAGLILQVLGDMYLLVRDEVMPAFEPLILRYS